MANSFIISKAKNKIIKEFIKDKEIVEAIDSHEFAGEKLINTHIFNYHQNPDALHNVGTFITIQVHIPAPFFSDTDIFVSPTIEIWIVSHINHIVVDNIPKVTSNRNDYISMLIDKKLNRSSGFGITDLVLRSNVEGSYQKDYVFRKMVFEGKDISSSLCDEEAV